MIGLQKSLLDAFGHLPTMVAGEVWLVGAGPGSVGNLSLLAVHALGQANVVIHDALVSPEILSLIPAGIEQISVGKRGGKKSATQGFIMDLLIERASQGQKVVRLKGGDPLVFGRGGEEAETLASAGIAVRIVPGMTSGIAGLTAAGLPATMRQHNQAIVLTTGHGAPDTPGMEWQALARTRIPIVLYMGMTQLERIAGELIAGGLAPDLRVAVVMDADTPRQRLLLSTLVRVAEEAREQGFAAPCIVMIGAYGALPAKGGQQP